MASQSVSEICYLIGLSPRGSGLAWTLRPARPNTTSVSCPRGLSRSAMGGQGPHMVRKCFPKGAHGPQGGTWAPLGPLWGGIAPKCLHMAPLGPFWVGIAYKSLHMGPLGPLLVIFVPPSSSGQLLVPRRGVFCSRKLFFFHFWTSKF